MCSHSTVQLLSPLKQVNTSKSIKTNPSGTGHSVDHDINIHWGGLGGFSHLFLLQAYIDTGEIESVVPPYCIMYCLISLYSKASHAHLEVLEQWCLSKSSLVGFLFHVQLSSCICFYCCTDAMSCEFWCNSSTPWVILSFSFCTPSCQFPLK